MLEKRFEAGGGLCTEQLTLPDFFHNPHAIYHMMVDYAPVYKDFDIEGQYGVRHIRPELQWSMPLSDGRSICIYTDVEKTCASIAKFSQKDADSYREMYRKYDEMMKNMVAPMTFILPQPGPIMAAKAEETEIGREMAAMTEKTPEEIINEMFENDHVRAMMLYICCHWGLDYNQSGVSFLIPLYLNRMVNYQLVGGGSHRMSPIVWGVIRKLRHNSVSTYPLRPLWLTYKSCPSRIESREAPSDGQPEAVRFAPFCSSHMRNKLFSSLSPSLKKFRYQEIQDKTSKPEYDNAQENRQR